MSRAERHLAIAIAALALVLRAVAFFRYRFDSDEPQHLHVAWGWTAGLVPYRDFFDNHTPLFHMITAPLLAILGERADILLWMRGAMLPLFIAVLVCTYVLGRRLYSTSVGVWSVVLLMLVPPFFLKSLEYRNDNLWNALWMIVLVIVTGRAFTTGRAFLTGLLLGAALAVSIKTVVLGIALVLATVIRRWVQQDRAGGPAPFAAAAAGALVVPGLIGAWFANEGAWGELVYYVAVFNSAVAGPALLLWLGRVMFVLAVVVVVAVVRRRYRHVEQGRLFFALTAVIFFITLVALWPLLSPRDLLPLFPMLVILAVARLETSSFRIPAFVVFTALSVATLVYYADRFTNRTDEHITMMNQVLGLTRPGEPLMDIKGETIYRRRPFYYAFETVTRARMSSGLIADTVPETIVRSRCYVTQADGPMFPPRTRRFVHENFLDMGRLRAAGQWVAGDGSFRIVVPGPYVVISEGGHASGTIDDEPYQNVALLDAGLHRFHSEEDQGRIAVLWAPAFERGYSPFLLQDREF